MKKQKWELWIKNRNVLEKDFKNYLKKETIRAGATKIEVEGHLNKAKRNLRFSRSIIDDLKGFYEWSLFRIIILFTKPLWHYAQRKDTKLKVTLQLFLS